MDFKFFRLFFFAVLFGSGGSVAASSESLTLIYSGNLNGELEPCGCTAEGDLGGIRRQATMLEKLRQENPEAITLSNGGLLKSGSEASTTTNQFILKGYPLLKYDAIGVQWSDLTLGEPELVSQGLPLVASNWRGETLDKQREIIKTNVKAVFFQWLDPENSPYKALPDQVSPVSPNLLQLTQELKQAKEQGKTTILGTSLPRVTALKRLPLNFVDILIVPGQNEQFTEPEKIGNTLILQPGTRGQRLGLINVNLDKNGPHVYSHSVYAMPKSIPDSEELSLWYKSYTDALLVDYKKLISKKKQTSGKTSDYIGAPACRECHQVEFDQWSQSRHAKAFSSLKNVEKDLDPNCVLCHTVGFNQIQGFLDLKSSPQLANVQCENCHGKGRTHVDSKGETPPTIKMTTPEKICVQCHTDGHSPGFDFEKYWPKINHKNEPQKTGHLGNSLKRSYMK
ncbi:MAG: multiheme c-type cytochrome [Alphaproteobacteria bacterium]|nr:multiheme c-type cytochrome [Alphaproteobacteria bacterium]